MFATEPSAHKYVNLVPLRIYHFNGNDYGFVMQFFGYFAQTLS